jgi:hypothetical protein
METGGKAGSGKRRGAEKAGCPKGPSSGSNTHRQRKREGEEIGGTERERGGESVRERGGEGERGGERDRERERGGERGRERMGRDGGRGKQIGNIKWARPIGEARHPGKQVGESAGAMILCGADSGTGHNGVAHIGLCWDGTKGNSVLGYHSVSGGKQHGDGGEKRYRSEARSTEQQDSRKYFPLRSIRGE